MNHICDICKEYISGKTICLESAMKKLMKTSTVVKAVQRVILRE